MFTYNQNKTEQPQKELWERNRSINTGNCPIINLREQGLSEGYYFNDFPVKIRKIDEPPSQKNKKKRDDDE